MPEPKSCTFLDLQRERVATPSYQEQPSPVMAGTGISLVQMR
jgi:hypothetical protein